MINKYHYNTFLAIRKDPVDFIYFQQPITKALLDENILFYHKYNKKVFFEQVIYIKFLRYVLTPIFERKFNILQKLYSIYYSNIKSFKFSNNGINMGRERRLFYFGRDGWEFENKLKFHGYNLKWDVPHELYKGNLDSPYSIEGIKYKNIY
jgi:hypothetical protein